MAQFKDLEHRLIKAVSGLETGSTALSLGGWAQATDIIPSR